MQGLESVSSLMDGELAAEESTRAIARLKDAAGDGPQRESWDAYHLIGDVLRDATTGAPALSAGFQARFSARLADEPTVLAPQATRLKPKSRWQTYAMSAAASVAAVVVVGWMALSSTKPEGVPGGSGTSVLATAPVLVVQPLALQPAGLAPQQAAALVAAAKPNAKFEHAHEYLLAHQGISPTTAFQGVAPYVRTVSAAAD